MNDLKANVLSNKQKSWLTYFNKSIYYGRQFNIKNPEWDFATVLQMFVNKDTCQMLVKEAYAIPDFHPWEEPFKLEYFSQEAQNLLKKNKTQSEMNDGIERITETFWCRRLILKLQNH